MGAANETAIRAAGVTLQGAADAFLSSPRCENANTRRAYAGVIDNSTSRTGGRRSRSKGGETEWVYWGTGTAHLLPRLLRLPDGSTRTSGPLFLASRKPVPARRPRASDICPDTGHARLGYDRARILLQNSTGWQLHQLRHPCATGAPPRR